MSPLAPPLLQEKSDLTVWADQVTLYDENHNQIGYVIRDKHFIILDQVQEQGKTWLQIQMVMPDGSVGGTAWILADETAYGPVGEEPPPTPTEVPQGPAFCEAPYWPDRTSDRKTGYYYYDGNYIQVIRPGGNPIPPHYRRMRRTHGSEWVTMREGKIQTINNETQIITLDLGNGLVVRRRFTENAQVMMNIHNAQTGMLESVITPIGGNLCDLEVGDAAAILHPSEAEGANPSPDGDLWGVFIVQ